MFAYEELQLLIFTNMTYMLLSVIFIFMLFIGIKWIKNAIYQI
jgi:hypothetical protein